LPFEARLYFWVPQPVCIEMAPEASMPVEVPPAAVT